MIQKLTKEETLALIDLVKKEIEVVRFKNVEFFQPEAKRLELLVTAAKKLAEQLVGEK